jgi:hypothetical protein
VTEISTLPEADVRRIHAALSAANKDKPSPEAIAELGDVLEAYPYAWKVTGDLGAKARTMLMAGLLRVCTPTVKESIKAGLEQQAKDLRLPSDGPLELMLIDQVITCWLDDSLARAGYAMIASESHSQALGDHWQRRLTITQQRYLRALETLARVRRLMRFTVQVNIAEAGAQVVNVAGDMGRP